MTLTFDAMNSNQLAMFLIFIIITFSITSITCPTSPPTYSSPHLHLLPEASEYRVEVSRDVHGDIFTMRGQDCDLTTDDQCGRRGRFAATVPIPPPFRGFSPLDTCKCQCAPSYPIYRDDVSECVKEINDCSLVKFVRTYVTEKVPVISLPINGELIYPGAHIVMSDPINLDMDLDQNSDNPLAHCQVLANEVLTPYGWQAIDEQAKVFDISIQSLPGSPNRTYLRFTGRNELRQSLEQKLILIQLACSVKEDGVQFELTPCAAVRVGWVPEIHSEIPVKVYGFGMPRDDSTNPSLASEESSMVQNTIKSITGSKFLSQSSQNYLIIGLSLGILGCMYVMALMIYLRTKTIHERKRTVVINSRGPHSPPGNTSLSSSSDTATTGINNPGDLSDSPSIESDIPPSGLLKRPPDQHPGHKDTRPSKKYEKKVSSYGHRKQSVILAPSQLANSPEFSKNLSRSLNELETGDRNKPVLNLKTKDTSARSELNQRPMSKIETSIEITPDMLDPDYSPASALEFIRRIRDIITSARGRIKNFRFRPTLIAIPEDDYFYHDLQITSNQSGENKCNGQPTSLSSLSSLTDTGNQVPPPPPPKIGLLRSRDHFSLSTPFCDRRRTAYFGFYPHSSERFTIPDDNKLFNDDLWCEYTGNEVTASSKSLSFESDQRRKNEGEEMRRKGRRGRETCHYPFSPSDSFSASEKENSFKLSRIGTAVNDGSFCIGIPEEEEKEEEKEKIEKEKQEKKELLDTLEGFVARNESSVDDVDVNDALNLTAISTLTFALPSSNDKTASDRDSTGHNDCSSGTSCREKEEKESVKESIYGGRGEEKEEESLSKKRGLEVKIQESISKSVINEDKKVKSTSEHIYSEEIYDTSDAFVDKNVTCNMKNTSSSARPMTQKTKDLLKGLGSKSKGKEKASDGNWSLQTSRPNSRASLPPVSPVSKPLTLEEVMARKFEECQKRMQEEKNGQLSGTVSKDDNNPVQINPGTIGRYTKKKVPSQSNRKKYQSGRKSGQSDGEDGAASDTGTTTTSVYGSSDVCSVSSCEISTTSSPYLVTESNYDVQSVASARTAFDHSKSNLTDYSGSHPNGSKQQQYQPKKTEDSRSIGELYESLVDSSEDDEPKVFSSVTSNNMTASNPIDVCLEQLASASVDDQEPFFAKFTRSTKGMETLEKIKNSSWRHFCNQNYQHKNHENDQMNGSKTSSKQQKNENDYNQTGVPTYDTYSNSKRDEKVYSSGDELESVAASSIAFNTTRCRPDENEEDSDDTLTEDDENKYETLQSRKNVRTLISDDSYDKIKDDDTSTIHEADVCDDEAMETMSRKFISCRNFIENKMFSNNDGNHDVYNPDQLPSSFVTKIPV